MNIGIVTVYDVPNYGSFLQAYSLKTFLEKHGHNVSFIQIEDPKTIRGMFFRIRPYGSEWSHLYKFIKTNLKGAKKYRSFSKAVSEEFNVVSQSTPLDLVILGSDEIWNMENPLFQKDQYFGIGFKNVISYAASIGSADNRKLNYQGNKWLNSLNAKMVRDKKTEEFVNKAGFECKRVVDPTFLIDRTCFSSKKHNKFPIKDRFLLLYSYGHEFDKDKMNEIVRFCKNQKLMLVSAFFEIPEADFVIECNPLEFFSLLKKADFVITSTFHGTVFSILTESQFVSYPFSSKTEDLLDQFCLKDRALNLDFFSEKDLRKLLLVDKIDYEKVNKIVEKEKNRSKKLLLESISVFEKNIDQS